MWRVKRQPQRIGAPHGRPPCHVANKPPVPFGDVALVPALVSGRPEADMARAMAAALSDIEAPTAADVYNRLRQAFPTAPLSARVGALATLMERLRRPMH
jgi:hypothetical protein